MGESTLPEMSHLRLLGLDISSNTGWEVYISGIAKSASTPVSCLYQAQKFLPPDMPEATLYIFLYKTTIRPLMEYCCPIWAGASACLLSLLDRVQKRIVNLVGEELGSTLQPLSQQSVLHHLVWESRHDQSQARLRARIAGSSQLMMSPVMVH
ncbi:uncharacterized protein [Asterias amurensis]|uniref:uncharacterized protein n=1 Tax=Asterias amurensis TaxID=7602 RepID=UPI003AB29F2B